MVDLDAVYTTSRAEAVARLVTEHYPLPPPLDCRMLKRGFNDVYEIVTTSSQRFVFRLSHHRARGAADVGTETDFIAHLDRCGVPVAAAVQARDGALFIHGRSPEGVLFRALEGRSPDMASGADARAHGVPLARLHNAAQSHRAAEPLYRLDLDHLLRLPLARIQELRGVVGKGHLRPKAAPDVGRLRQQLRNCPADHHK